MKKKSIILVLSAAVLAFLNNLRHITTVCDYETTVDGAFVDSIFNAVQILKQKSLILGMENLFVLIAFIFIMHDFISKDILHQGVYALVRQQKRTKWLIKKMVALMWLCGIYMGSYLLVLYEICAYYVERKLVLPVSGVIPKTYIALFMILYISAIFTVILDIRIGRNISCIIGTVVLCVLIVIGMYEPYKRYQDAMWLLALNPACAMFVYTKAGIIAFLKMAVLFLCETSLLVGIFARWLENIDIIAVGESEGY